MDCMKVGRLILALRREKGMTQRQLGDAMNISDKTVSKWERGLGCPDVTLLGELSGILGVNMEKMLMGELDENTADGGNMKRLKFYVCPTCGNILTSTSGAELSCCGRRLEPLVPKPCEDAHSMRVESMEEDFFVTFPHEMTKEHFIRFLAYATYDRALIVRLYPEQGSEARFPRLYGGKMYMCCSRDGLFEYRV